jgi:hypothetical protein
MDVGDLSEDRYGDAIGYDRYSLGHLLNWTIKVLKMMLSNKEVDKAMEGVQLALEE